MKVTAIQKGQSSQVLISCKSDNFIGLHIKIPLYHMNTCLYFVSFCWIKMLDKNEKFNDKTHSNIVLILINLCTSDWIHNWSFNQKNVKCWLFGKIRVLENHFFKSAFYFFLQYE